MHKVWKQWAVCSVNAQLTKALQLNKLKTLTNFRDIPEGGVQKGFPLGLENSVQTYVQIAILCYWGVCFSVGKIIYWARNFKQWAGMIYWVGKVIY